VDLQEAAARTEDPNAPYVPGDHCRFCPATAVCPALSKMAHEDALAEFGIVEVEGKIPLPTTHEQLAKAMSWIPILKNWCKAVDQYAYQQATVGVKIPGYKLVQKRAQRKWTDEVETIKVLEKGGMLEHEIYEPPKLKSPAQLEKLLDKDEKKAIEKLITKKSTGLALVEETDKRAEVASGADADFDVVEE